MKGKNEIEIVLGILITCENAIKLFDVLKAADLMEDVTTYTWDIIIQLLKLSTVAPLADYNNNSFSGINYDTIIGEEPTSNENAMASLRSFISSSIELIQKNRTNIDPYLLNSVVVRANTYFGLLKR